MDCNYFYMHLTMFRLFGYIKETFGWFPCMLQLFLFVHSKATDVKH